MVSLHNKAKNPINQAAKSLYHIQDTSIAAVRLFQKGAKYFDGVRYNIVLGPGMLPGPILRIRGDADGTDTGR